MKLGVSTACYYPLETEEALREIGKAGVKTTEIFFNAESELKESFIDLLFDIKEHYGITVASIHPTFSLAESFLLFSAYDRRFYEGIEKYSRYGEIAARLGAKYIIMHGGKPNGILSDQEYCERYMQLKNASLKSGVTVLQENVRNFRAGDIEFMRSMKEILGNEAEFCFDIKQSVRCGYPPFSLINEFFSNIHHYHISDHSLASDCLLPLNNGGFDFEAFFQFLHKNDYKGSAIIEVYNNAYSNYSEIGDSYKKALSLYNNIKI